MALKASVRSGGDPAYQRSARSERAPLRLHELGADGGGEGFEGRGVHFEIMKDEL